MAEKIIKVKITYACWVDNQQKVPGDTVDGPEGKMRFLCSMHRATEDLSWQPPKKEEPKKK